MHKMHRLRANADFQLVRREGRTLLHPLLVLSRLSNGLGYSRFGFAVGRPIGNAVRRNRLKRQMREAVRLRLEKGQIVMGWDVVLVARRPIQHASFSQIDQAIGVMLRRADLEAGRS